MNHSSKIQLQLIVCAALVILFFIMLSASVRCEPDDMIISLELRENGFLTTFLNRYFNYSFRPFYSLAAFLTIGWSDSSSIYSSCVFIFYTAVYTLFIFSVYRLLAGVFNLAIIDPKERLCLLSVSILLVFSLYFLTTERIEIFGWFSASVIHLVPVVFSFFTAWIILKKQQRKADYFFLITGCFAVSGGSEHIPLSLLAIFLYAYFFHSNTLQKKKLLTAIIALAVFFLLNITNPGLWLHYKEVHESTEGFATTHSIDPVETTLLLFKPHKLIGLALLLFSCLSLKYFFNMKSTILPLKFFIFLSLFSFFITAMLSYYAYHTLAVGRAWFMPDVSLCILLFIAVIKLNLPLSHSFLQISCITALSFCFYFDIRHIPKLYAYAKQHDIIISNLQEEPAEKMVILTSFPAPDLTNQVLITSNPNDQQNILFCRFYGIKANVSLNEKKK